MSPLLARRATGFRDWHAAVLLAGVALAGCDHAQSFHPDGVPPEPIVGAARMADGSTAAAGFAGGIPFGMFAQPLGLYGEPYSGGHRNIPPADLLNSLQTIQSQGGKVVLMFAGSQSFYKDADGHFSLSLWQGRVDRYRGVDFSSYIADGTVIAHYLVDEPDDRANWNNQPIPGATLEAMAQYSKQLWPGMATVVRVEPGYLAQGSVDYQYLDAAWAQHVERKGAVGEYIGRNVADAKALGLELIVGLNLLKGGPSLAPLTASQLQDRGSVLLSDPYPCAFINWQYDATYLAGTGIAEAMDSLRGLARNRSFKSCAASTPAPPPDPDPPAPTTTTISAADPDPSSPGQTITVAVTVAADASTPEGTVAVSAVGGTESCEVTLSDGAGACSLALTETGDRTLRASFDGGASFGASSDTEPHEVRAARQSVTINWSAPQDITYGTALGAAQLNAAASSAGVSVPGSYSYEPAAGTVLNAGATQPLRVTFTPTDGVRYEGGSAAVDIDVAPRAPTVVWTVPSFTSVGPLNVAVLNATATGVAGAAVPGTFTYTPAAGQVLDARTSQTLSVAFQPSGSNYTAATKTVSLAVRYPWSGFFDPVDNPGRLNTAKAGVAIPVRFSLGGNRPAPVVASGSPESRTVSCPSWPTDAIEQTVSASSSSIRYDAPTGRYIYTWKSSTSWANSCRKLIITLKDGTVHEATFRFSR